MATWNEDFTKVVQDGAAGNQAQKGIFYEDERGRIKRLTEAEGHEISYNPETEDTNPIGQEAPEQLVRSYNISFGKEIIIKKGALNYEFFAAYLRGRPTGDNAKLRIYLVDFRREEVGASHNRYYAEKFEVTCTVDSSNETDARLTVNFSQAGSLTTGIMERTDTSTSDNPATFTYGFTPSGEIAITALTASDQEVTLSVGAEKTVSVDIQPLGSNQDFTVESDSENVSVRRLRQSVVMNRLATGTATVTVTSAGDVTKTAEIIVD
jgi:hypothetical protein